MGVEKTFKYGNRGSGHYIAAPYNHNKSNEVVTFAANAAVIPAGTVLGKLTSGGNFVPIDLAKSDGSQTPAGIAYNDIPVSAVAQKETVTVRDIIASGHALIYPAGATDANKATIDAGLLALEIIVRR